MGAGILIGSILGLRLLQGIVFPPSAPAQESEKDVERAHVAGRHGREADVGALEEPHP